MLRDSLRSLLAEPAASDPPPRGWQDWAIIAVAAPGAVVEAALLDSLVWPVVSLGITLGLLPLVLWRRTRPLACAVTAFGVIAMAQAASIVTASGWAGLGVTVYVLLFPYALLRWGSGRDVAIGVPVVLLPWALTALDEQLHPMTGQDSLGTILGGGLVLLLSAALGASFRYREHARAQALDQAKLLEREQLARELHDSVAHHVSAIAIRAQAGRVVGGTDPAAALDALAVIEEEASRTLAEMRTMVGALRRGGAGELAPQQGVADIPRLAETATEGATVTVELTGDLDDLTAAVDAALFRLAQESITNAVRHARQASHVVVRVVGGDDAVDLTVRDDGEAGAFDVRQGQGFGLAGMAERASLLGGTLVAGPDPGRGWIVHATIPRGSQGR